MTDAAHTDLRRAPAAPLLPERSRAYVSYIFDSRNWDGFRPRPGDVVISTSYKSGTTWMQNILRHLVFAGTPKPPVSAVSPWLDRRNDGLGQTLAMLEAQEHRRFIKSHLPLDTLPYHPQVRYIVVVRDPRDVFMSFWNHYSQMTDSYFAALDASTREPPMPRCPKDIHTLWEAWINRGWFPWQTEGWPHSGNLYHTASWWAFRHLENILFVHFADLLADLRGEIARIGAHVGITRSDSELDAVARAVTFEAIGKDRAAAAPMPRAGAEAIWNNGLDTFFFKGTNGRWREVLTATELDMYEQAKKRCVPDDCAAYLERGRAAWAGPA